MPERPPMINELRSHVVRSAFPLGAIAALVGAAVELNKVGAAVDWMALVQLLFATGIGALLMLASTLMRDPQAASRGEEVASLSLGLATFGAVAGAGLLLTRHLDAYPVLIAFLAVGLVRQGIGARGALAAALDGASILILCVSGAAFVAWPVDRTLLPWFAGALGAYHVITRLAFDPDSDAPGLLWIGLIPSILLPAIPSISSGVASPALPAALALAACAWVVYVVQVGRRPDSPLSSVDPESAILAGSGLAAAAYLAVLEHPMSCVLAMALGFLSLRLRGWMSHAAPKRDREDGGSR
jgi:hypothetical protein